MDINVAKSRLYLALVTSSSEFRSDSQLAGTPSGGAG
jgi:hypothetical protein